MSNPRLNPGVVHGIRDAMRRAAAAPDKRTFARHIKDASTLIVGELRRTERELAQYMQRQVDVRKQLLAQLETLTATGRKDLERFKKEHDHGK